MKRALLILGFLLWLPLASAFADELDNQVREIAHQLRCPTCQGLSVKESEAGLANNMKLKIRSMLEEGKSEEEVLDYFVERYGEWILRSPKKTGFNLVLWTLPALAVVIGAGVVVAYVRSRPKAPAPGTEHKLTPAEQAEVEKDLNRWS